MVRQDTTAAFVLGERVWRGYGAGGERYPTSGIFSGKNICDVQYSRRTLARSLALTDSKPAIHEKHVVLLGLIAEEPVHAYGLEDKIRKRYMTEWTAIGFSSIYRGLAQLEERGLIDSRLEHEGQGATRKVYEINETGRGVLADAVLDHLGTVRPLVNPFHVGLAFVVHAPREQVLERLRKRGEELERWIRDLGALEDPACGGPSLNKVLVLDNAMRHLKAEREFLNDAMRLIEGQEEAP